MLRTKYQKGLTKMLDNGLNILVLGKAGVGKSSYCNYIFGEKLRLTSESSSATTWEDSFIPHSVELDRVKLNIFDCVGLEPDTHRDWACSYSKI